VFGENLLTWNKLEITRRMIDEGFDVSRMKKLVPQVNKN